MTLPKVPDPRSLLKEGGLSPKGSWSQNFLTDPNIRRAMAAQVLEGSPQALVELGAGVGTLSLELAPHVPRFWAVERDRELAPILRKALEPWEHALVVEANAATLELSSLGYHGPLRVVGNLPYHLSTHILLNLIRQRDAFDGAWIMLQREVAQRLAARPGGRAHGTLSLLCQLTCDVAIVLSVSRGSFFPKPKVDSAVLRLVPLAETRYPVPSVERFMEVVRAALGQRRKTLSNALSAGLDLPRETVAAALAEVAIDGQRRGESLELAEMCDLTWALFRRP